MRAKAAHREREGGEAWGRGLKGWRRGQEEKEPPQWKGEEAGWAGGVRALVWWAPPAGGGQESSVLRGSR